MQWIKWGMDIWMLFSCIFTIRNVTKNKNLKHSLTNFVNCRTSSNWSSKLKKSEQVCKEGETDPAPSQEITEQTYNGMGVWADTWLSPMKCFLLHVYAEGTTCISYPGSIKGVQRFISGCFSYNLRTKGVWNTTQGKFPKTLGWTWITNLFLM